MSKSRRLLDDLLDSLENHPPGGKRLPILQEAANLADELAEDFEAFQIRQQMMNESIIAGRGDVLAVAFAWCLNRYDEDPEEYPNFNIMWAYRWVIDELSGFLNVTKKQITDLIQDMKERYERVGASLRPCYMLEMNVYPLLGDIGAAVEAFERWETSYRDELADDRDSELAFQVSFLVGCGEIEKARKLADPLIKRRRGGEHEIGAACSRLLLPMWAAGELDDAEQLQRLGVEMNLKDPRHVGRMGNHVAYLALTSQFKQAQGLFCHVLPDALSSVKPFNRLIYYMKSSILGSCLQQAGLSKVTLTLPEELPIFESGGEYSTSTFTRWLQSESGTYAKEFDARNGTRHFFNVIKQHQEYLKKYQPK
ncbi:MAG: hypothetical protein R3B84_09330 [Zavarzinella sp.]